MWSFKYSDQCSWARINFRKCRAESRRGMAEWPAHSQVGAQVRRALIAEVPIFFQGARDRFFELTGNFRIELSGRGRSAVKDGVEYNSCGLTGEGMTARHHFLDDGAKRKHIRTSVDVFSARLFGRHVGDCSKCGTWLRQVPCQG